MNEDCTYLLCTCSDRALRLYYFDHAAAENPKKNNQFSRVIYLQQDIKDVING